MSSTDPQRPGDDPRAADRPAGTPPASAGTTSTGTTSTGTTSTGTTDPQPTSTATTDPQPTSTDTGRHAVQRPTPTPPETPDAAARTAPEPTPSTATPLPPADPAPGTSQRPAPRTDGGTDATSVPGEHDPDDARATATDDRDDLFPDSHAPRTPHAGAHVLGALVGLVLAPFAVVLLLLGQSRILEVQVDGWDASLELLGIVLVSSAALVLAVLLVLGLWSAAVPLTAGLLVAALGGLQLYAPGVARTLALDVLGGGTWDRPVALANVAGTSGTTLTVGVLLLTAGVVLALARRHGVRLGAFRERNRTA